MSPTPLPATILLMFLASGAFGVASAQTDKPDRGPEQAQQTSADARQNAQASRTAPARPVSLETLRMMETIEKKTRDLKKREKQLQTKERQLKVLEKKVKADLEKVQQVLKKTEEMLGLSKDISKEKIDTLVKIYSSMPPQNAAPLVGLLDETLAVQIITRMKSKIAGQVLGQLDPKVAKSITEKLIGKKLLEGINPQPSAAPATP
ncbi:MAG: MotE family protein [Nitrospinales bacterium]